MGDIFSRPEFWAAVIGVASLLLVFYFILRQALIDALLEVERRKRAEAERERERRRL